ASSLGIGNTIPNLLIPVIIYYSLTKSNITGLILGFILGMILDLNNPLTFGISSLLFVLIAFLYGQLKTKINREQKIFLLILIFLGNIIYFLFSDLMFMIFIKSQSIPIFKILLLIFYNSIYSIIIIFFLYLIDNLQISIKSTK
ncbi:MAG: rod shape-determining protein MreD, partial [Candidatus Cloacimonetes bacterium]|nr:rod shape-determining protein MreD [Candidatus Cloacimonadota bacterium]